MSDLIKKLEELKGSLKGSKIGGQTYSQIFGARRNARGWHRCSLCGRNSNNNYFSNHLCLCLPCSQKKTSGGVGISESTVHNKIDALIAEEEKKIKDAKNKQKTTAQKASHTLMLA